MTTPDSKSIAPHTGRWSFRDEVSARNHVCDHVLTADECRVWALHAPEASLREILQPAHDATRRQIKADLDQGRPSGERRRWLDFYRASIQAGVRSALKHQWMSVDGPVHAAMSLEGLCLLSRETLRTAYFAGHNDPNDVRACRHTGRRRRDSSSPWRTERRFESTGLPKSRRVDWEIYDRGYRPSHSWLRATAARAHATDDGSDRPSDDRQPWRDLWSAVVSTGGGPDVLPFDAWAGRLGPRGEPMTPGETPAPPPEGRR